MRKNNIKPETLEEKNPMLSSVISQANSFRATVGPFILHKQKSNQMQYNRKVLTWQFFVVCLQLVAVPCEKEHYHGPPTTFSPSRQHKTILT